MTTPTNSTPTERVAEADERPLVLALSGDLMLAVRIGAAAHAAGFAFLSADSLAQATEIVGRRAPAALVLELTAPAFPVEETLQTLRRAGVAAPVIAFYPHVMKDLGRAARELGCTLVVPRSRFLTDTAALLRAVIEGHAETIEPDSDDEAREPAAGSSTRARD